MPVTTFHWASAANGDWTEPTDWLPSAVPNGSDSAAAVDAAGSGYVVTVSGSDPAIVVAGLAVAAGAALSLVDASAGTTVSGDLTNGGFLGLDSDAYAIEGGSTLSVTGTLTNIGQIVIGPPTHGLSADSLLRAGALAGSGSITLHGGLGATPSRAMLDVLSAAPGTLSATTSLEGNALLEFASGQIVAIAGGVTLQLNGAAALVADAATPGSNSALTGLADIGGTLDLLNGASATLTGDLTNAGFLRLDSDAYSTEGGSSLTVDGTLTNSGHLVIGPSTHGLSADSTLTVGALTGGGSIELHGSFGAAPKRAAIDVLAAAPGTLNATTTLDGDALLAFASGQIQAIAGGVTLQLNGTKAFVADAADTGSNSALSGLAYNAGTFQLINGASAKLTGDLTNAGFLGLDSDAYTNEGGSSLTVDGTLTNSGQIVIGPSTHTLRADATLTVGGLAGTGPIALHGATAAMTARAVLDVLSAAPGTLNATTTLDGDALLAFASGQIQAIAGGVTLQLNGPAAFVADAADTSGNSALAGLAYNVGTFQLINGASAALTGNLDNAGFLGLDSDAYTTEGGSSLTVAGTLTNTGAVEVGSTTNGLSASATLTVGTLLDSGSLALHGSVGSTPNQAVLDVLSAAPGTLTATTTLDGASLLEFASGQIAAIASGVTLQIKGADAFVADAGATGTNSAISGLTANAGAFDLVNGASATLTGDLLNSGFLGLDSDSYTSEGGSSLTVDGTLTNNGQIVIGPSTLGLSANATLTAGALAGAGSIALYGNLGAAPHQAAIDVESAAPGTLTATARLYGDAVLQFASGQIAAIASGATLLLYGANASVADAGAASVNSALSGLAANAGAFDLIDGASAVLGGNLGNSGVLGLDSDAYTAEGGSSLTVDGTLTNSGQIILGPDTGGLSANVELSAQALSNTGSILLYGSAARQAILTIAAAANSSGGLTVGGGATLHAGGFVLSGGLATVSGNLTADAASISGGLLALAGGTIQTGTLTITALGSLSGTGTIDAVVANASTVLASGGTLDIAGVVAGGGGLAIAAGAALDLGASSAEAVSFAGAGGTLRLDAPASFTGTITDFAVGDTLSLKNDAAVTASASFDAASGNSTLTVALSGGGALSFKLAGDYAGDVFTVGQTGTDSTLTFSVPAVPTIETAVPVDFGILRAGATPTQVLTIGNAAGAGAPSLDVSIGGVSGAATASGSITRLPPGASDGAQIVVGLNTQAGGVVSGVVTLNLASDVAGNATALPVEQVAVQAVAYRTAAAALRPAVAYLHVGDPASEALIVGNTDPNDGYSESLIASVVGFSGGIVAANGTTGLVAPGASDASAVSIGFSTATTGQIAGSVSLGVRSIATGADPYGTTDLGTIAVPVTVYVDNYAQAAFATSNGTLTGSSSNVTLDLGTIAANSGPLAVGFGVSNVAPGPADLLSGSFTASGSGAFTPANLGPFSGLGAGQSDTAPSLTLDTSQTGVQTETIVLAPHGSNAAGYSEDLPGETLTVVANVAPLPPPSITAPATLDAMAAVPVLVGPLSIADANMLTQPLTVTVSDTAGALSANASGTGTVSGSQSNRLVLKGSLADINTELASLTYKAAAAGSDTIQIAVRDQHNAAAAQSIAITTAPTPATGAVLNEPVYDTALLNTANGLGGLSLSDPSAEANGDVVTLTLSAAIGTLGVNNPPDGATVTGQGTNTVTLTGTVQQINASLADDGFYEAIVAPEALIAYLASVAKHSVSQAAINVISGTYNDPLTKEDIVSSLGGVGGKVFSLGVAVVSFELNSIAAAIAGTAPPDLETFKWGLACIIVDAHVVEPDGTIFDFNPTGEFVFATSTQSGDSFDVQVRLQPLGNSTSASVVTQVAAAVGTDRVTFGIGRAGVVWVNGAAVPLAQGVPDLLSGGELTQLSASSYQIVWNTGEVLTVTDSGSYLNVQVAGGPNTKPGSITGLASFASGPGSAVTLPDGTVLSGSLSTAQLYQTFANAWRVPQQYSLLDYGPGQSTATFTDTAFPENPVTLADLPANVVASAAAVAAAAGITDPGVLAAAEFDYIASGGNTAMVAADASLLAGRTTTQESVTPTGSAPVAIGVLPDQAKVMGDGVDPIAAVFDVYLTGVSASDTVVDWSVVANGAGSLDAAAFGGTLPSGSVTIAAGRTTAQVTIDVPAVALGVLPSEGLAVDVSSPSGGPVFTATATETLAQPVAGPPPVPQIESLTRLGTFTQVGNSYTLDLGDVQYGEPLPDLLFGITNAGTGSADALSGTLSVASADGFTVTGTSLPSALDAGQSYNGLDVAINYTKFGPNSETITFHPQDSNNTGFSSPLPAETLTIIDNIVVPTMVYSQAWGDVHIVTYNGLKYDFQEAGEFTLAKSRLPGDSFDIQLRLQPWYSGASVSVITQVAVSVGTDRVTIDDTRADEVWVDGAASSLSASNPTITLNGGTLTWISSSVWKVVWNTGEEMTVTDTGRYLNVSDGIPVSLPNQYGGLQGEDAGQANDFQLPDGTVLPQPLSYAQLHSVYADGWRVSQPDSLFDYLPGQSTATFTDRNFPADVVPLSSLPSDLTANAAAMVAAAGITDPGIAQAAEEDYLATGDSSFITAAAAVQKQVSSTTPFTPSALPSTAPTEGVAAVAANVVAAASGPTQVSFNVFLTAARATDTTVAYTVVDGGAGTLGAGAFGGSLPTGSVVIAAGQTSAQFSIAVPQGALGSAPDEALQVQVSATDGTPVFTPRASTVVANSQPVSGSPALPLLSDLTDPGALTATSATSYTLDLGALTQSQQAAVQQLAVQNAAAAPADALSGNFSAPLGAGFTITGNDLATALAAGQSYTGLLVTPQTARVGSFSETFTFTPTESNASGYTQQFAPITLTIVDSVGLPAQAGLNTPGTILFANAHVGDTEQRALSISNTAPAPAAALDVVTATGGAATAKGSISGLAAGSTDASSIVVGLDTTAAGQQSGVVALTGYSDSGSGQTSQIALDSNIDLFGTVYRKATASIAPVNEVVHVGDPGTLTLSATNTAANDGYSEALLAAVTAASGGLAVDPGDSVATILPGVTDPGPLSLDFSTARAGVIAGNTTVSLTSDGGTGAGSIDGLGRSALTPASVPVSVTVDNYAVADIAGDSRLSADGSGGYVLNLGTATVGGAAPTDSLSALNTATGPADWLDGSFTISGSSAFTNSGFAQFTDLAAGGTVSAGTIALSTAHAGTFTETLTLTPTGGNASGFRQQQTAREVTVTGTVAPPSGTAQGDVHMATFDGLHYDFQATGAFVLTRSTVAGHSFQIQVEDSALAGIAGVSWTTQAAAQLGGGERVTFDAGRSDLIWVDGRPDSPLGVGATERFADGSSLVRSASDSYRLTWSTGESLSVVDRGAWLDLTTTLAPGDGPGSVQGLLGGNSGQGSDLALPDGKVLAQPLAEPVLYGAFADAWRVAAGTSLLDGPAMQFIGGPGGASILAATAPGQVLAAGAGITGLSDAGGYGATFQGTLAQLAASQIEGVSARDLIDIGGLDWTRATLGFTGSDSGGTLHVSGGGQSGDIRLAGQIAGSFHALSDGHGGTLVTLA